MSDKGFMSEYKSIKAPEELYDRILNADKKTQKNNILMFRRISASAAALAIIAVTAFVVMSGNSSPEIYVGAEQLTGEVALTENGTDKIMIARTGNTVKCEFSLKLKKESVLIISEGYLFDENDGIILEAGEEKSFSDKLTVRWEIPFADTQKEYYLTLSDGKREYSVKMYFDSTDGNWAVSLTE